MQAAGDAMGLSFLNCTRVSKRFQHNSGRRGGVSSRCDSQPRPSVQSDHEWSLGHMTVRVAIDCGNKLI